MTPFSILYLCLSLATAVLASASSLAANLPSEIFYWPITAPQPTLLARLAYDPTTLQSKLLSYTPPVDDSTSSEEDALIRIGFFTSTPSNPKQWVGTLVSRSALTTKTDNDTPIFQLLLDSQNDSYHVALSSAQLTLSPTNKDTTAPEPVEIFRSEILPRPALNRPVVVNPDGKGPEEVVEKTFFQKYWWVFLIITFLAMTGSAEPESK
ncbi:conserved hypothetical protein [Paecilomyces variotii No. 5]|uniref:ER membrane protein complex subunit 10 n=1 Tax=Byssochlamys spectabilis (strain No. 5 / NBRC 109023) TaxID=1356009 RepID=V5FS83_BYSSN|nr:conserved hypothetical protein [Paecilomyces variotii No. 5]